jgi:hypothetical protein
VLLVEELRLGYLLHSLEQQNLLLLVLVAQAQAPLP